MNRKQLFWLSVFSSAALILVDALWLEKVYFQVKHFRVGRQGENRGRIRIIHLSDLHLKQRLVHKHRRLLRRINRLAPDLLLITGDTIDERGEPTPLHDFLRELKPSIRILAIPGNHDHKAKARIGTLSGIFASHGGKLLVNESIVLNLGEVKMAITGVDDFVQGTPQLREALGELEPVDHHLMLIHSPKQQERIMQEITELNQDRPAERKLAVDYILAGHNHGGQVTLGSFAPRLPKRSGHYLEGWYNKKKPYLYLSRGFGTSALPVRFMAPAEIAVFEYGL